MASTGDLIDFNVIEGQKENIQPLPGGRSARKLAELYSPSPLRKLASPTAYNTQNVYECIRAEFEAEIQNLSESDDPLDVFDRYVRWTLDTFPSAQATPQSQLHTLLERATKEFITSAQYKNDPRYLRLWIHYIHFFSDSPRETYLFLSRHGIGEGLALFYEEYAAWLEGAARWSQAKEVFELGIERQSRPVQRLLRKYKSFEERLALQSIAATEPSSPALPAIRPALAVIADPFGSLRSADSQGQPQDQRQNNASRKVNSKLAIFSDASAKPAPLSSKKEDSKGWDTIGSLSNRRKENAMEPKPWVGETLKTGGKKSLHSKMTVFKDPRLSQIKTPVVPSKSQVTVHPQTGKKEYIFVDLEAIYPSSKEDGSERSFEEVMAGQRGWLSQSWVEPAVDVVRISAATNSLREIDDTSQDLRDVLSVNRAALIFDENGELKEDTKPSVSKKMKKIMEVNETQTIKTKLDSPSGPRFRKQQAAEPTMTIHTRAATDDIYEIFNAPLGSTHGDEDAENDDYETDGDYTVEVESAGGTRQLYPVRENDEEVSADMKHFDDWEASPREDGIPDVREGSETGSTTINLLELKAVDSNNPRQEGSLRNISTADAESALVHEDESERITQTMFIPIPPEDYDPPTRPYRDPVEMANNRLPFMTPITERTECSIDVELERRDTLKTPCRRDILPNTTDEESDCDPLSSPLRDIMEEECPGPQDSLDLVPITGSTAKKVLASKSLPRKGPIIGDVQCNPVDEAIRGEILGNIHPPLSVYDGFHDYRDQAYELGGEIRRFSKALSKASKNCADRASPLPAPIMIEFSDAVRKYVVKRELGAGAFAPVYLVESICSQDEDNECHAPVFMGQGDFAVTRRSHVEALKMETPPSPWEFYIMRLAHSRLGPQHRAVASLSYAHELRLYRDEAFLFLSYHSHGTLLDVVNLFRAEPSGVMDEQLAMFFTVELMRTVESLHSKSILHGDLKADNCLLRLDTTSSDQPLSSQWNADGSGGWSARGVVLIDFGRGIDMKAFVPDVEFIADWNTSAQDCAEMREGRPWTWQIDYHGLAGIIHCLLFGKYIETARRDQGGLGRTGRKYKIKENLKRYWQSDLWSDCFEMLLNPASFLESEDGRKMPLLRSMKDLRLRMEEWLGANCDRGIGLKSMMSKLESQVKLRRS